MAGFRPANADQRTHNAILSHIPKQLGTSTNGHIHVPTIHIRATVGAPVSQEKSGVILFYR